MTYSVGITGRGADQQFGTVIGTVDDLVSREGGQQRAMSLGTPFLVKALDGSEAYFVYDAERSDPGRGVRVIRRL